MLAGNFFSYEGGLLCHWNGKKGFVFVFDLVAQLALFFSDEKAPQWVPWLELKLDGSFIPPP